MEHQLRQVKMEVDPAAVEKVNWVRSIPFFAMHAACFLAFWAGISWVAVLTCLILYYVRMFGITGGYHRYFAHASYKTSRAFQFFLAWLGGGSGRAADPPGIATLEEVLAAKQDLWGLAALRQTNGASYEFFADLLPPLRYVNAAFHH